MTDKHTATTVPPSPFDSQMDSSLAEPLLSLEDREANHDDTAESATSSYISHQLGNVRKILALTWFAFTSRSMWSQSALSMLVFLLQHDKPERIGFMTAAMGLCQVLSSLFASALSDKWQRNTILRLSSVAGAGAVALTAFSIVNGNYEYLLASLCLWGTMWGISDTALPSLFADSIPIDKQQTYYQRGSRIMKSANIIGPLIALGVFQYLGDEWTVDNCAVVIFVGLAFSLPVLLILCILGEIHFFEDDFDPPEEIVLTDQKNQCSTDAADLDQAEPQPADCSRGDESEPDSADSTAASEDREHLRVGCCCKEKVIVPLLITVADILSSVASGMSMRYFPVFLASNLGLSPVYVQGLHLAAPFGQATSSALAKCMAPRLGPGFVSVLFHWVFISFLLSMLYGVDNGMSTRVVTLLYLLHTSLMNSTGSLSRSMMSSVLEEEKIYRWTVAESIQLLLWSGGAAVGGVLVGKFGILFGFYATAGLQLIASLPLLILCCVMKTPGKSEGTTDDSMPGTPRTTTLDDSEAYSETVFEESREHSEDSVSSEFFDCELAASGADEDRTKQVAVYRNGQCLYQDGSPAPVPAGECISSVPESYMVTTHGSKKRAQSMWERTQKWRMEKEVWRIHTIPSPWHMKIKDAYPHSIHGWTKKGDVVIYERPGKMQLKHLFDEGCTISDMTAWYTYFMEYLSHVAMPAIAEERRQASSNNANVGGRKLGFLVVMDMEDAGMSLLSSEVLSYLKLAGEINSSHYPTSMKQTLLIKTGPLLSRLSSVLRAVLPWSVEFEVYSENNYKSALDEYIDEEQIPAEYGGNSPYPLGEHPIELRLLDLVGGLDTE